MLNRVRSPRISAVILASLVVVGAYGGWFAGEVSRQQSQIFTRLEALEGRPEMDDATLTKLVRVIESDRRGLQSLDARMQDLVAQVEGLELTVLSVDGDETVSELRGELRRMKSCLDSLLFEYNRQFGAQGRVFC